VKVVAITGHSGSGKTTLIVHLIEHFIGEGQTVSAIKHTHHPLNEEHRGDTGRFLDAGASPVILAREDEAVVFSVSATARIGFATAEELLAHVAAEVILDVVLVEGFQRFGEWPRIHLDREHRLDFDEALAILDRIWRPGR
jgi:molybdopterin-guanine dinucleotide biosynthesis protein B